MTLRSCALLAFVAAAAGLAEHRASAQQFLPTQSGQVETSLGNPVYPAPFPMAGQAAWPGQIPYGAAVAGTGYEPFNGAAGPGSQDPYAAAAWSGQPQVGGTAEYGPAGSAAQPFPQTYPSTGFLPGNYFPEGGAPGGFHPAGHLGHPGCPAPGACDALVPGPVHEACCPCYVYTRAELFMLWRSEPERVDFTSQGVAGPIVLSTDDFDFEHEPGIRGTVGVPLSDCLAIEATYFGMNEWSERAAAVDPNLNLFSVFTDFGLSPFVLPFPNTNFLDGASTHRIVYDSEIHSAELVATRKLHLPGWRHELWFHSGARYLKLREEFVFETEVFRAPTLIGNSNTDIETDNDLVGFQLGLTGHHFVTRKFRVTGDMRTTLAAVFAEQKTTITANQFLVPEGSIRHEEELSDTDIALIAEGGLTLAYDLTCWLSVTGGYRVLYVDGVALAAENFNDAFPIAEPREPRLDDNGKVLFHGANAGLEVRW